MEKIQLSSNNPALNQQDNKKNLLQAISCPPALYTISDFQIKDMIPIVVKITEIFKEIDSHNSNLIGKALKDVHLTADPKNNTLSIPYIDNPNINKLKKAVEEYFLDPNHLRFHLKDNRDHDHSIFFEKECDKLEINALPYTAKKFEWFDTSSLYETLKGLLSDENIRYIIISESRRPPVFFNMKRNYINYPHFSDEFLIRHKTLFAEHGIEILASEFFSLRQQINLEAFHHGYLTKSPPPPVSRQGVGDRADVIKQLSQEGIRTVGIEDDELISRGLWGNDNNSRKLRVASGAHFALNEQLKNRIEKGEMVSRNPYGKGKAIIWIEPESIGATLQLLGREQTAIIGFHGDEEDSFTSDGLMGEKYPVDLLIAKKVELSNLSKTNSWK